MPRLLAALAEDARAQGILQLELQVATWTAPAIAPHARAGFDRLAPIPRALRDAEGFADKGALRPAPRRALTAPRPCPDPGAPPRGGMCASPSRP